MTTLTSKDYLQAVKAHLQPFITSQERLDTLPPDKQSYIHHQIQQAQAHSCETSSQQYSSSLLKSLSQEVPPIEPFVKQCKRKFSGLDFNVTTLFDAYVAYAAQGLLTRYTLLHPTTHLSCSLAEEERLCEIEKIHRAIANAVKLDFEKHSPKDADNLITRHISLVQKKLHQREVTQLAPHMIQNHFHHLLYSSGIYTHPPSKDKILDDLFEAYKERDFLCTKEEIREILCKTDAIDNGLVHFEWILKTFPPRIFSLQTNLEKNCRQLKEIPTLNDCRQTLHTLTSSSRPSTLSNEEYDRILDFFAAEYCTGLYYLKNKFKPDAYPTKASGTKRQRESDVPVITHDGSVANM